MKSKLVLAIILSVQIQIAWAQARIRYDKKGQATPSAVLCNHLGKRLSMFKMGQPFAGWGVLVSF